MIKKNWENPEIMGLGLQSTKEDESSELCLHKEHVCQYCGAKFGILEHTKWKNHEKNCGKPVYPLPDPEEGGPIPTFS